MRRKVKLGGRPQGAPKPHKAGRTTQVDLERFNKMVELVEKFPITDCMFPPQKQAVWQRSM